MEIYFFFTFWQFFSGQHAWVIISIFKSRSENVLLQKRFCLFWSYFYFPMRLLTGRRSGARPSYISQTKEITTPPSWTKAFKNNSSLFKFFFIFLHTNEIQYLDHAILLYVKNFISGRRLTSGDGWSSNIAPKQAVYYLLKDLNL